MKISVIIPALNEAEVIQSTLLTLQTLRTRRHEIILVDGGSRDNTVELAAPLADKIIHSSMGRAIQMNAGAAQATGDIYWFLHSDTIIPRDADSFIQNALMHDKHWGRFDVRLSGKHVLFRVIELMMNLRSCITGIATGDQGIFIQRTAFNNIAGFNNIPLMEDIVISKRLLKNYGRPACIKQKLLTSSRRWENNGLMKTILLMWRLRLAFFMGANPEHLAQRYTRS